MEKAIEQGHYFKISCPLKHDLIKNDNGGLFRVFSWGIKDGSDLIIKPVESKEELTAAEKENIRENENALEKFEWRKREKEEAKQKKIEADLE